MGLSPMLAATPKTEKHWEIVRGHLPLDLSKKLDGIRTKIIPEGRGRLVSRTLKDIPNRYTFDIFSRPEFHYKDGEMIVGEPFGTDVMRRATSGLMSQSGEPNCHLYLFDDFSRPELPFTDRQKILLDWRESLDPELAQFVTILEQHRAYSTEEMLAVATEWEKQLYEGAVAKKPDSPYKFGRSTIREGGTIKIKFFVDDECEIIGYEEEYSNQNEAEVSELGRTKRSSHQENQVPKGTLGAFICKSPKFAKEFKIGTGFTAQMRQEFWDKREELIGRKITFKYQASGTYEKPRIPVFKWFREDL